MAHENDIALWSSLLKLGLLDDFMLFELKFIKNKIWEWDTNMVSPFNLSLTKGKIWTRIPRCYDALV